MWVNEDRCEPNRLHKKTFHVVRVDIFLLTLSSAFTPKNLETSFWNIENVCLVCTLSKIFYRDREKNR